MIHIGKNKLGIMLLVLVLLASFVYADAQFYNRTILGHGMTSTGKVVSSSPLEEDIEEIQTQNAEGDIQLFTKESVFEYKK